MKMYTLGVITINFRVMQTAAILGCVVRVKVMDVQKIRFKQNLVMKLTNASL